MQEEGKGPALSQGRRRITRRRFLGWAATATAVVGTASAVVTGVSSGESRSLAAGPVTTSESYRPPIYRDITLHVNGIDHSLRVDTRTTLAEALRDELHLTGTKIPCDQGECGGCTVLVDGKNVYSCSMLAVAAEGHEILTIEGLADEGRLHPVQAAFVEKDAVQCGFCTPGQIMSIVALLKANPDPDETAIRQAIQGNLCRCGTYTHIIEAAKAAAAAKP